MVDLPVAGSSFSLLDFMCGGNSRNSSSILRSHLASFISYGWLAISVTHAEDAVQ
jgi:hypothetical protein